MIDFNITPTGKTRKYLEEFADITKRQGWSAVGPRIRREIAHYQKQIDRAGKDPFMIKGSAIILFLLLPYTVNLWFFTGVPFHLQIKVLFSDPQNNFIDILFYLAVPILVWKAWSVIFGNALKNRDRGKVMSACYESLRQYLNTGEANLIIRNWLFHSYGIKKKADIPDPNHFLQNMHGRAGMANQSRFTGSTANTGSSTTSFSSGRSSKFEGLDREGLKRARAHLQKIKEEQEKK